MNNKTFIDAIINDLDIKDTDVLIQIRDALSKELKDCIVSVKPKTEYSNDEILNLYFSRMEYQNRSKGTIKQYKIVLLPFRKSIDKPIECINEYDIIGWLNQYEKNHEISKRTKEQKRKILQAFFTFLLNEGLLKHGNPMAKVLPISYTKKVRQPLTESEINKIRIACTNIRDNAIFETLLSTGCRVSEIANLKIEDIDMENNMAKIKGKGDKERIVFLSARAIEFLKIYLQQSKRSDNYIFVSNHRPYRGLSNKSLERIIRKMSNSANIDKAVFPHLLRHTFATNAINKGMPISSLCDLMGHSSIDTTRIYAKNSNTKLKYDYEMHI